jgi:hypothetical protein
MHPFEATKALDEPITMEELRSAVRTGKSGKATGCDGIGNEFYKLQWNTIKHELLLIIRQMHTERVISAQQKHGILVFIPKTTMPERPDDYRALTLLNANLKILTRILAKRLSVWAPDIIHKSQQCGIARKTIFEATATMRDRSPTRKRVTWRYAYYTSTSRRRLTTSYTSTCMLSWKPTVSLHNFKSK